jgi:three-Cys-motif partner protein
VPKTTTWRLEPHTAVKHAILKGYLGAWFPILASNRGRVVFLDGFAGPGEYEGGEMGSPMIALNSLIDHNYFANLRECEFVFLFNEMDPDRFAALQNNLSSLQKARTPWPSNVKVHAVNQDFGTLAKELATANGDRLAPTFAFLDPFGYKGLEMATLATLLSAEKCEVFCYFDYNSANRFATEELSRPVDWLIRRRSVGCSIDRVAQPVCRS